MYSDNENSSPGQRNLDCASRIFKTFRLLYGNKFDLMWRDQDYDDIVAFWASKLFGYRPSEIKRGLDLCEKRDHPPTLPEFLKLCREPGRAAAHDPYIALPLPDVSPEQASANKQAIARALNRKPASDHRRWIQKALDRAAAGDVLLPKICLTFAHEALAKSQQLDKLENA